MRIHRLVLLLFLGAVAGLAEPARAAAPFLLADVNATGLDRTAAAAVSGTFLPLGRLTLVPMSEPGSGREMWVTDGTDAGTRPLLDLCPGPCGTEIIPLGVVGRAGIFLARPGQSPMALWKSDGTLLGTFPLFTRHRIETCRAGEPPGTAILGSTLFFSARYQGGCELWTTDGTAAGTRSLREITPADIGSHVLHELIAVGDRVFFVAADLLDWGLWRSDGTPEGTIRLRGWSQEKPFSLVVAGARLFFLAKEEETDVWTSDGTPAGTRRITQSLHPGLLREIDGSVYFTADEGTSGREIWRTDAAATSPRPVTRFANASPFVGTWSIEKLGNRLLFGANDGLNGLRLWTTDGRPESTAPLTGCPGGCPLLASDTVLVRSGPDILFKSSQGTVCGLLEQPGNDLWASDGTGAGTRRLADFCPCCLVSGIRPFRGGNLFALQESDTSDPDLWVSDATPRGTRLLRSGASIGHVEEGGPGLLAIFDRAAERMQLWTSDGTAEPTRQVTGIGRNGWSSQPRELVPAGDGIRFQAYQPTFFRLWESHGTPETTAPSAGDVWGHLVPFKDLTLGWAYEGVMRTDGTAAGSFRLTPEGAGEAENLAVLGDRAVFLMRTFDGTSLWKTDGTVEGTRKLLDLPGSGRHLRPLGAEAVFVVGGALWKTDGTTAGTRPLTPGGFDLDDRLQVALLGSGVYFTSDEELWRTDGTSFGTYRVAEGTLNRLIVGLAEHRGALYLLNETGVWRTDGTDAGTVLLRSFPGLHGYSLAFGGFTPLENLLFFVVPTGNDAGLWRTDGTPQGTVPVGDIAPGAGPAEPSAPTVLGGRLYFAAHDEKHGVELWESDGTTAGTRLVQDIAPGALSSSPDTLTASGGRLYFAADDGIHGREPWVYAPDGAACVPSDRVLCLNGGRFQVEASWRDFSGGSGRGHAVALTPDTGTFWFFNAANVEVIIKVLDGRGVNGHHWVFFGALSNVEYALTVTDTWTGAARRYTNLPGHLGSVADTQAFGPLGATLAGVITEGPAPAIGEAPAATRTSRATETCVAGATRLCLNRNRFAVEARWKDSQGHTGTGQAVPLSGGDTGYFWFFDAANVEVVLKVLDGRPLNGKHWVFYGALSNVEYTLTVTDTETGVVKTYTNPGGRLASVADTGAF